MIIYQAETLEAANEVVKAVEKGEVSQLVSQLIDLSVQAGKSILVAILIFVVGRFIVKLINKLVGQMLDRRKVDPTIASFTKSFVNVLLMVLLIITVVKSTDSLAISTDMMPSRILLSKALFKPSKLAIMAHLLLSYFSIKTIPKTMCSTPKPRNQVSRA